MADSVAARTIKLGEPDVGWSGPNAWFLIVSVVLAVLVVFVFFLSFLVVHISGRRSLTDKSDIFHYGAKAGRAQARSQYQAVMGRFDKSSASYASAVHYTKVYKKLVARSYKGQENACQIAFDKGSSFGYGKSRNSGV
jgi:hypothetical protein